MLSLPLLPPFISVFGGFFGGEAVSETGMGVEGGSEGGGSSSLHVCHGSRALRLNVEEVEGT